jgi:hypothetical protein
MAEIELSAVPISYEDTGGDGPVIVLVHGLLITASLWEQVVKELESGFRCVRPTMPLGAHRTPMRPDADLSLRGQVRLLVEFLERLELATLLSAEETSTQVQIVFADALQAEWLAELVAAARTAGWTWPKTTRPGRCCWRCPTTAPR